MNVPFIKTNVLKSTVAELLAFIVPPLMVTFVANSTVLVVEPVPKFQIVPELVMVPPVCEMVCVKLPFEKLIVPVAVVDDLLNVPELME